MQIMLLRPPIGLDTGTDTIKGFKLKHNHDLLFKIPDEITVEMCGSGQSVGGNIGQ